jgi:hypothetical protein
MLVGRKFIGAAIVGLASLSVGGAGLGAEVHKLTTADVNYVARVLTDNRYNAEECGGYREVASRIGAIATAIKGEGKVNYKIATAVFAMGAAVNKCHYGDTEAAKRKFKDDAQSKIRGAAIAIRESSPARIAPYFGGAVPVDGKGFGRFYWRVIQWAMARAMNRLTQPFTLEVLKSLEKQCVRWNVRQWTGIPVPKCSSPVVNTSMTYEQGISAVEKAFLCEDAEYRELALYLSYYDAAVRDMLADRTLVRWCNIRLLGTVISSCTYEPKLRQLAPTVCRYVTRR